MDAALLLRAGAALAAVLILAVLLGRLARTHLRLPGAQPSALRLRATLSLDTRRRLHLVDTAHGTVLVLTGGATDSLLPWPGPPAHPGS